MPALPIDEAGKYVAAAYVIFFALVLVYVSIIGSKIARLEKDITELLELEEKRDVEAGTAAGSPQEAERSSAVQESLEGEQPSQNAGLDAPRR